LNADVYVLSDIEVFEQDIIEIISRLNAEEAVRHDIISNRMLLAVNMK
jgi:hypothetical protein